jgi:hypothetical protein
MAVEAYRRVELPDEIRILPQEGYGVFFHGFSPVPTLQLRSGAVTIRSQSGSSLTKHFVLQMFLPVKLQEEPPVAANRH